MGDQASETNIPNLLTPPDFPNDAPGARGTLIFAGGYIFPIGTLPKGPSSFDPTDLNGSIGTWCCQLVAFGPDDADADLDTGLH